MIHRVIWNGVCQHPVSSFFGLAYLISWVARLTEVLRFEDNLSSSPGGERVGVRESPLPPEAQIPGLTAMTRTRILSGEGE
jgi:hypothetical protein